MAIEDFSRYDLSFYPVLGFEIFNNFHRSISGKTGVKGVLVDNFDAMTFWREKSYFKYNKMLASAYYLNQYKQEQPIYNPKNSVLDDWGVNGNRMVDSGGFQMMKQNKNINASDVIDCYYSENAEYGFVLDIPNNDIYEKGITDKVVSNIKQMIEHKNKIDCKTKILNVTHGKTMHDLKEYCNTMFQFNEQLDGWAISVKPGSDPIHNVVALSYVYEKDLTLKNKYCHFLGVTGINVLPIIIYLRKTKLLKEVTYDSSSYIRQSINGLYINPLSIKHSIDMGSKRTTCTDVSNLVCECPVCQNSTPQEMIGHYTKLRLHNLYQYLRFITFLESFSKNKLREYITQSKTKMFSSRCITAIEMLDYFFDNGCSFDSTIKKFYNVINYNDNTNSRNQTGLSKW